MYKHTDLTAEDYVLAKTDIKYLNKVYEANIGLIKMFKHKLLKSNGALNKWCAGHNCVIHYQDINDALTDALIMAIQKYEPDLGCSFSNFAILCMKSKLNVLAKRYNKKNLDVLSLTSTKSLEEFSEDDYRLSDGTFEKTLENMWEDLPNFKKMITFLTPREVEMAKYLSKGLKYREIAELENEKLSTIAYDIKAFHARLRRINKLAKQTYELKSQNYLDNQIANTLGLRDCRVVNYYLRIYNYLYSNAPRPNDITTYLRKPYKCMQTENDKSL